MILFTRIRQWLGFGPYEFTEAQKWERAQDALRKPEKK